MNNVVGGVVIAPGNVNLLTKDSVVVAIALGAALHHTQIRTGAGLGQVHGASPLPGINLGKIDVLERLGTMGINGQGGTRAQEGLQGKGHVSAIPNLTGRCAIKLGETLTAGLGIGRNANPSALTQSSNSVAITG